MAGDVAEQVGLLRRGPAIPVTAQDAPIAKVVHIGVAAAGDESHRGQLDVVTPWRSPGVDGGPRIGFADSGAVAQGIEQGRPKARVVGSIPTSPSSPQRWTRVTPSCRMGHGDRGTTRRDVLRGGAALATVAVAGGLMDACVTAQPPPAPSASLGPPETTTLRVPLIPPCDPWYAYCEPFLRDEGFTDLKLGTGSLSNGDADLAILYGNSFVGAVDSDTPLVALAGMHTGCIMVVARPGIATVADLRGKTVAIGTRTVPLLGKTVPSTEYGFLLSLLSHIGMQPSDVNFVEVGVTGNIITPFTDGKVDAIFVAAAAGPVLMADPENPGHV